MARQESSWKYWLLPSAASSIIAALATHGRISVVLAVVFGVAAGWIVHFVQGTVTRAARNR